MKKIYALMAAAIAVSASASASSPFEVTTAPVKLSSNVEFISDNSVETRGMQKEASIVAGPENPLDADNMFCWHHVTRFSPGGWVEGSCNVAIDGTDVTIYGLYRSASIKGTYDPETKTIRVNTGQSVAPYYYKGEAGDEYIQLYTMSFDVKDGKIVNEVQKPYIEFKYYPNGIKLSSGATVCSGGWAASDYDQIFFSVPSIVDQGSGFACTYMNRLRPWNEFYSVGQFKYVESEWADYTTGKLTDGWFKAMNGVGFEAYDVKVKQLKTMSNVFLVMNPYGTGTPYGDSTDSGIANATPNAAGYIYIDASDADCVRVRPFVNCGYANTDQFFFPIPWSVGNQEGVYYYTQDWTVADIVDEAEIYGDPISTMTTAADGTKTITIPTARVANAEAWNTFEQWTNSLEQPIPMETTLVLPPAGEGGVDGIISDNENAPKRFFNLQGVEIATPDAGQVVIVREGNKSAKAVF